MPALVAGIHVLRRCVKKDVDGRDKPSHDDIEALTKSFSAATNMRGDGIAAALQAHAHVLDRDRPARSRRRSPARDHPRGFARTLSDPNPIGPGLLAFFTFWPAVILTVWGLVASITRYRRAQSQS
jgi:hypothetical protein